MSQLIGVEPISPGHLPGVLSIRRQLLDIQGYRLWIQMRVAGFEPAISISQIWWDGQTSLYPRYFYSLLLGRAKSHLQEKGGRCNRTLKARYWIRTSVFWVAARRLDQTWLIVHILMDPSGSQTMDLAGI
jgi:hypothetical protein